MALSFNMGSRMKVTCAAFFASLVFVVSFLYTSAETYYVLPTPSIPCPVEGVPCFTLSQYAAKPSDYFASDATIILLPGNHTLDSVLTIRNIKSLKFEANRKRNLSIFLDVSRPNQMIIVTCSLSARFRFEMLKHVQVIGMTFIGCMNNEATRVDQFSIEDCSFDGQGRNGTGLVLTELDNAFIASSSFSSNTGTYVYDHVGDEYGRGGGAMVVSNCRNINIMDCLYKNNSVTASNGPGLGGVVWAWNSTIAVNYTTFANNSVSGDGGGGVVAAESSTITATYSIFTKNFVSGDNAKGGVVAAVSSTITATDSIFTNNSVIGDKGEGGVVFAFSGTITSTDNIFTNNFVSGDVGSGGVVAAENSAISTTNSIFNNNSVSGDNGGGGVVSADSSTITATNSIFNNNSVSGDNGGGGAVSADSSTITATNSTFNSNLVCGDKGGQGGVVAAWNSATIIVTNSTFNNNSVRGGDGAGGVVAAWNVIFTATNSTFTKNYVSGDSQGAGGVVYAENSAIITATNSLFNKNYVSGGFGQGGVVVANCSTVTTTDSVFTNNFVSGDSGQGGVLVALNSTITATNSTFNNNIVSGDWGQGGVVVADSSTITATNSTFNNNSVSGNYGQSSALLLTNTTITTMAATSFQYNVAPSRTVYAVLSRIHFSGSTIISNNCGSLYAHQSNITFAGNTNIMNNSIIANCTFSRWSDSEEGGVLTGILSNLFFIDIVNIEYNSGIDGGGISVTESKVYTYGRFNVAHNTALLHGGGIFAYQSDLNLMEGSVRIFGNTAFEAGGGIHAVGSTTAVRGGSVVFDSNHAKRGGGMGFMQNSKLYIIKNHPTESDTECNVANSQNKCIDLTFADNIAEYGGALYVYDDANSGTCEASSSSAWSSASSECFIQSLALQLASESIFYTSDVNLLNTYFANNTATVAGTTLYGGLLDRCTVSPSAELFFTRKYTYAGLTPNTPSTMSYLLNITNLQPQDFGSNATVSSDAVRVCFCRENHPDCSYQPPPLRVNKGETFNMISVVAVDQVNNTVANSRIHASLSQGGGLGERQAIQQTSVDGSCTVLTYNVLSPHDYEQLHLYAQGPCMDSGISTSSLTVYIVPCPIGFKDTDSLRCACDPLLDGYVSNCSIDNESVQRKNNAWFSYVNDTMHQGYILHKHCPFDYCQPPTQNVSVNLNNKTGSNDLCAFNRSGKLCGSCEDGLSLSLGSSHCKPCSNNWIAMIAVFAMAGIALVAFLVFCNLTVVSGTINGLTLYANVIAANRAILFPIGKTNILTVFIAWINLDFGFESCFFAGLDSYWKVWLQLAFPLYILFLVGVVIFIANRHYKYVRFFFDLRNPVTTLATLFLLCYTKFVRTIIAGLSFGTLEYSDGFTERVWLFDANVPYLKGKHVPLFVASLLILVLGLVYTLLIFSWQWIKLCHLPTCLKKIIANYGINAFMDAYHAPFNTQHRYWTGLLLLVRFILYLISALNVLDNPSINLMSIIVVMIVCLLLLNNPKETVYRKWTLNAIESSYLVNLIILAGFTLYIRESNGHQTVLAYISTGIAFFTFLATVIYHAYTFVLRRAFKLARYKWPAIEGTLKNRKNNSRALESAQLLVIHRQDGISEVKRDAEYGVTEINGLPDVDTESIDGDPIDLEELEITTQSIDEDDSETATEECVTLKVTETVPSFTKLDPSSIQQNNYHSAILAHQLSVNLASTQPATRSLGNEMFVEVELHNFASLKSPPQISPSSRAESEEGDDEVYMGDELTPLLPQDS